MGEEMLPVILGIFKIIGIVLLILLAVILFVILVVLFVPIRYGITGKLDGESKQANVKVSWLLKLIRFRMDYVFPETPSISFKILWIDIWKMRNKPKKKPRHKLKKRNKKNHNNRKDDSVYEKLADENIAINDAETDLNETDSLINDLSDDKQSIEIKSGLKEKFEKIIFKITSLYDKIRSIINNIRFYLDILQEKETQELLKDSKNTLLKVWKSAGPKVFLVNGRFGFETPDTTGKVYGYYCMLTPQIGRYIQLEPEFESKTIEADCIIKGKITIFIILINAIKIYFDKRLQTLISKLKDGGKKNG